MFGILQKKTAVVRSIDLCKTMDLVALLGTDGSLSIYRTLTWERVLFKLASEIVSSGSPPTAIGFSASGKVLGLGHEHGELSTLDLESGETMQSHETSSPNVPASAAIVSITWISSSRSSSGSGPMAIAAELACMQEHFDAELGETKDNSQLEALFIATDGEIMLSLTQDGTLAGHMMGLFPLFSWCSNPSPTTSAITLTSSISTLHTPLGILFNSGHNSLCALGFPELSRTAQHQQCARLVLTIASDMTRLYDLLVSAGRKWKDATKVIPPKLNLLKGVLDGYEMGMGTVEFMYTVAHCGAWHPAAASFSQHWNDQGLSRLRSAIDSTSQSTLRLLQLRAVPLVTNAMLRCRELIRLYPSPQPSSSGAMGDPHTTMLYSFCHAIETLLHKLDATIHEARLSRESLLLYLAFIKEQAASQDTAPTDPPPPPDLSLAPRFMRIFDPRAVRAPESGSQAQAEHVCGTHLYAYLQDQELPPTITKDHAERCGYPSLDPPRKRDMHAAAAIEEMLNAAEDFSSRLLQGGQTSAVSRDAEERFKKASLVQLAKEVREQAKRLMTSYHSCITLDMVPAIRLFVASSTIAASDSATADLVHLSLHGANHDSMAEDEEDVERQVKIGQSLCSAFALRTHGGDHDRIIVIIQDTGTSQSCTAPLGLYCACVADTSPKFPPGNVFQMRWYVRPDQDGGPDSLSLLCVGTRAEGDDQPAEGTTFVFKIDLADLRFVPLDHEPLKADGGEKAQLVIGAQVNENAVLHNMVPQECSVQHRTLDLDASKAESMIMSVSALRGVVAVSDGRQCVVLDIESLEEEEEEEDEMLSTGDVE